MPIRAPGSVSATIGANGFDGGEHPIDPDPNNVRVEVFPIEEDKRCQEPFPRGFFGRPRGRSVVCRPNAVTVRFTQASEP